MIRFENVEKIFANDLFKPKRTVLNKINFSLKSGRITGLLGHNGAGKTTTIKILFQLMYPTSGKIYFQGSAIQRKNFVQFGYMPEINKIPLSLTPMEILSLHTRLLNLSIPKQKIMSALEQVELGKFAHLKLGQMSKGMQRRVAWVQATIHNPEILILDEPFSGLDPFGKTLMQGWIWELKAQQKTMLLCTHDIWAIQSLCEEMVILREGQVVFDSQEMGPASLEPGFELEVVGIAANDLLPLLRPELGSKLLFSQGPLLHKIRCQDYDSSFQQMSYLRERGIIVQSFQTITGREAFVKSRLMEFFKRGNIE
jgi:ABC-2 type transport system ATP-binding protein